MMPGITKRRMVGSATKDSLHEKYMENASPEMNCDVCIKNFGTYKEEITYMNELNHVYELVHKPEF